ncbi:YdaU family protein [Oxalobacter sp. JAC-2022]|uniref:YdaU family protein n=1 Tax=Oxalobacter aliiformigenes TaxID=2946593 RepID=UPI0022AEFA26|nr:YdaU family protein [Oxalobacter aliiformigenes]MCZ4066016.1 YdaU family protein [Oxalobacter aliiformigenes]
MNFYKHYIGDYQRDTGHLTLAEHGAYRLMLDAYYATGRPLPGQRKALYRLLRADSTSERRAIDAVASQFWETADGGLVNRRAALEIARAEKQAEVNRQIAIVREERRRQERQRQRNAQTAGGSPLFDTGPDGNGSDVLDDPVHVPAEVFGVCKVNNTQVVSGLQPVSCTDRDTATGWPAVGSRSDAGVVSREPSHSQNHNHSQNQTGYGCSIPATNGGEKAFFSPDGDGFPAERKVPDVAVSVTDGLPVPEEERFAGENGTDGMAWEGLPAGDVSPERCPDETAVRVSRASAALAKAMREEGVMAAAADPRVMALARQGVEAGTVKAACAEARRARPDERIGPGYVVKIVERWVRDAGSIRARGAMAHGRRCVSEERRRVLDELTGRNNTLEGMFFTVDDDVPGLAGPEDGGT